MNRRRRKKIQTALLEAVAREDTRRVRALLRAGASPDTPDRDGGTPLYKASVSNLAEIARALLAYGADPDPREDRGEGMTALRWAQRGGYTTTVTCCGSGTRSVSGVAGPA